MKIPSGEIRLNKNPLTVGALLLILSVVGSLATIMIKGSGMVDSAAVKAVSMHESKDVDRAHAELKARYVPRTENQSKLYEIERKCFEVHARLDEIKHTLDRIARRRSNRPR